LVHVSHRHCSHSRICLGVLEGTEMKTVIEMAKEAGFMIVHECDAETGAWYECFTDEIERFAELVRADERAECAVIAETAADYLQNSTFEGVAAAIRARGTHEA